MMRKYVLSGCVLVALFLVSTSLAIYGTREFGGSYGTKSQANPPSTTPRIERVTTLNSSAESTRATSATAPTALANHTAIYQPALNELRSKIQKSQNLTLQQGALLLARASYVIYQASGMTISKNSAGKIGSQDSNATKVIQNAVDSLNSSGGIVVLEPGDYVLSGPIALGRTLNATLTGEGWDTVISAQANFANYLIGLVGSNWTIMNLLVNCTNQLDNGSPGIYVNGGHDVIKNVYVTQSSHGGIDVSGVGDTVEYNSLIYNKDDGIIARGTGQTISYNLVSRTAEYNGISFVGAKNEIVSHNLILHTAGSGVGVEPFRIGAPDFGPPCTNLTIIANLVFYAGDGFAGIKLYSLGATNATVSENLVVLSTGAGVLILDRNSEIVVSNNTIDNPSKEGIYIQGATAPTTQIWLLGNTIYNLMNSNATGILLTGVASNLSIQRNSLNGTAGTGISLSGNNTITTISLNHIVGLDYGIVEHSPSDYNAVIGNSITNIRVKAMITVGNHDIIS